MSLIPFCNDEEGLQNALQALVDADGFFSARGWRTDFDRYSWQKTTSGTYIGPGLQIPLLPRTHYQDVVWLVVRDEEFSWVYVKPPFSHDQYSEANSSSGRSTLREALTCFLLAHGQTMLALALAGDEDENWNHQ